MSDEEREVLALCWGGCGTRASVPADQAAKGWRCLPCQRADRWDESVPPERRAQGSR